MRRLDPLDWGLICQLAGNSRITYQELARIFKLSPNAIKNRIRRLLKQGVIKGFTVIASMEMLGAEHVAGIVTTDGSEKVIEFMKEITTQSMVCEIYRTSDRRYEYWAMVKGASETLGFKQFLKQLDSVVDVQMRPIVFLFPNKPASFYLNTRGKKVTFTNIELRVLRSLTNDARMSVSQISRQTGLTPRRVRKAIRDLQEGGGVHFSIYYNVFALGDMEFRLRIRFDESQTTGAEVITEVYENHSDNFWWASIITNEPMVEVGLIIDNPGAGIPIIREIEAAPSFQLIEDFVSFPRVVPGHNPLRARLMELLDDTGRL